MSDLEVPYLPISDFDAFEISKRYTGSKSEKSEDALDIKGLSGKNFPEEIALILIGMGMDKYISLFKKMNIALDTFLNLKESELKDIGITDPDDRKIIAKNLSLHQKTKDDLIVPENHIDDLKIVKNVSYQLLLLQNYCAYVELQMKKQTLTDYGVDSEASAKDFLKMFAERALKQSQIMSNRIYDEDDSDALINKLLRIYNLSLPKALHNVLSKKKKKRKHVFKVVVLISVSSLFILTGRYLLKRR